MPASKSNGEFLPDGTFDFSAGVDSSKVTTLASSLNPNGLKRNQLAWLFNGTVRNGAINPRAGWQPLVNLMASGHWQGGYMYEPDGANPYLVCVISGIIYSVLLEPPYTLTDLTGGNPALRHPDTEMCFFVQGENYLIIQAGDYGDVPVPTLPLFWNGTVLRRSIGITTVAPPGMLPGINEIPAATCMDYFGGRIWYAQHRQFSAGDMVGGPSGTVGNRYRDSILSVTENPLVLGGDGFTVPTNAGNIRALKHAAQINASLGEGEFFIFTRKQVYSLTVPVTRYDWINATAQNQPKQTVVQINNGAVGDRCVVPINGDLFYLSFDPSIRSLITAVRYFAQWGNTPISQNEQRLLEISDRSLMRFSSAIEFDNRVLFTALPQMAADGVNVVHPAIAPLDFDIVTSLESKTAPVWEGAYSGMQIIQLFNGDFGGLPRAFSVMISDIDGSLNIWELQPASKTENGDNRLTYAMEFAAYTWSNHGLEFTLKQLMGGECWVDKVSGTSEIDVYYRPDADPCWYSWFHTSLCASRNCEEQDPATECYPDQTFRQGYKAPIVFPAPRATCDAMHVRPSTIGYQFQVRIVIKGWLRIRGLMLYAIPHKEPQYHGIACQPGLQMGMKTDL